MRYIALAALMGAILTPAHFVQAAEVAPADATAPAPTAMTVPAAQPVQSVQPVQPVPPPPPERPMRSYMRSDWMKDKRLGGFGFFQIGGAYLLGIETLNDELAEGGYGTFGRTPLHIGGAGFGVINRFIIGGEGAAIVAESRFDATGKFEAGLTGGYGLLHAGYLLVEDNDWLAYLTGAVGAGGLSVSLSESPDPQRTFRESMMMPLRSEDITQGGFLMGIAAGVGIYPIQHEDECGRGGLLLGVRGGFNYQPVTTAWRAHMGRLSGGPKASLTGGYLALTIGGGGQDIRPDCGCSRFDDDKGRRDSRDDDDD